MQGLGDWVAVAPTAFMYRLWTGRLIHQEPQGHAHISFCYSMKTLDLLSVWCAGDVNSPACRASIGRILEEESGQWLLLACIYKMGSCCPPCALWSEMLLMTEEPSGWRDSFCFKKYIISELNLWFGRESSTNVSIPLPAGLRKPPAMPPSNPLARLRRLLSCSLYLRMSENCSQHTHLLCRLTSHWFLVDLFQVTLAHDWPFCINSYFVWKILPSLLHWLPKLPYLSMTEMCPFWPKHAVSGCTRLSTF